MISGLGRRRAAKKPAPSRSNERPGSVARRLTVTDLMGVTEVTVDGEAAVFALAITGADPTELLPPAGKGKLRLSPKDGNSAAMDDEDLREELRSKIEKTVAKELGGKYAVHSTTWSKSVLRVVIWGYDQLTPHQFASFRGGRTFADKCSRTLQRCTGEVRTLLGQRLADQATISAAWEVGKGVSLTDGNIDGSGSDSASRARLDELRMRQRGLRTIQWGAIIWALVGAVGAGVGAFDGDLTTVLFAVLYGLLPALIVLVMVVNEKQGCAADRRELSDALELRDTDDARERRALKLLQANTFALRRYYDQALRQRTLVSLLGVGCILGGFGTVAAAFLVLDGVGDADPTTKIVVGVVGAVGGILANYVAVIFLRMFGETVRSATSFHTRLVETQHAYLGYLAIAKVGDVAKRDDALAGMSAILAQPGSVDGGGRTGG
jgi:hypothetical protein